MPHLEDWKNAVIHLEGAASSQDIFQHGSRQRELAQKRDSGEITQEQYAELSKPRVGDIRYQGTGIFIEREDRYYLFTARHVLEDKAMSQALGGLVRKYDEGSPASIPSTQLTPLVFVLIMRVPSLDEWLKSKDNLRTENLVNLSASVPRMHPYTFSVTEQDVAIISLSGLWRRFADDLLLAGFRPISMNDVGHAPTDLGSDVFTVGYPGSMAVLGTRPLSSAEAAWESGSVSVSIASFGKVAMLHPNLPTFWADMTIYPGNSGGPVVEDGKLVGIVSAQPSLPIAVQVAADQPPPPYNLSMRLPFARVVKATFLHQLLAEQIGKDKRAKR